MKSNFPRAFVERLKEIYPDDFEAVLKELKGKPVVIRGFRGQGVAVSDLVSRLGGTSKKVKSFEDVYEVEGVSAEELTRSPEYQQGEFYIQSLSSICIPMVLDPKPGERVLDLCAAPGSKTSQMASQLKMQSEKGKNRMTKGDIIAVELDKERCRRLREVLELQGVADMVEVIQGSGTKLPEEFNGVFDKVLVDAPCSADARFDIAKPRTFNHWAKHRIKGYVLKQKKLINSGLRYLKQGGVLVYSTCSMNPEENEAVIDYALRRYCAKVQDTTNKYPINPKSQIRNPKQIRNSNSEIRNESWIEVLDVELPIEKMESVTSWHGKVYDSDVKKTFRMRPDRLVQPFFVARLKKFDEGGILM